MTNTSERGSFAATNVAERGVVDVDVWVLWVQIGVQRYTAVVLEEEVHVQRLSGRNLNGFGGYWLDGPSALVIKWFALLTGRHRTRTQLCHSTKCRYELWCEEFVRACCSMQGRQEKKKKKKKSRTEKVRACFLPSQAKALFLPFLHLADCGYSFLDLCTVNWQPTDHMIQAGQHAFARAAVRYDLSNAASDIDSIHTRLIRW